MKGEDFIVSGFDSSVEGEALFAVDFAAAKRLEAGGSTCDVFECIVQRRRVFVKRLKAEYRDNPLYRSAFNKEYDLGVSLSHPSLPRYVGFGGDYIVMDFIEGDTLADLIKRGDKRLQYKRFARKLLLELVDVVEYLHNRNIVHCDIKPDNIIISPYADRPATLIDFDKAYSPWLDSTHGNAGKYGCDGCADGNIDFKGLGLIADKLGIKRVADACRREDVNAESLKKLLRCKNYRWWILGSAIIAIAILVGLWPKWGEVVKVDKVEGSEEVERVDFEYSTAQPAATAAQPPADRRPQPLTESQLKWIESLIAKKSAEIDGYRQDLWQVLDSDTISISDKRTAIVDYQYQSGLATNQIIFSAVEKYRNLPEADVQTAVRRHPAYLRLMQAEEEMDRRLNEWSAKGSPRSSGRSASPPDTIRGADCRALHR